MSDRNSVKVGVCRVFFGGRDLGYTKGGVTLTITTQTQELWVDTFGVPVHNEWVVDRKLKVTAPLAESVAEIFNAINPGSTIFAQGGAKATGTIALLANPTNGQRIVINGQAITFKSGGVTDSLDCQIGSSDFVTASFLATMLTKSSHPALFGATATAAAAFVSLTAVDRGDAGNKFTLAQDTLNPAAVSFSGATLTGGSDPAKSRVEVNSGAGVDLVFAARELRLHPAGRAMTDRSEDIVVPFAAPSGNISFAYKLDSERIYAVDFEGLPDASNKLFSMGDLSLYVAPPAALNAIGALNSQATLTAFLSNIGTVVVGQLAVDGAALTLDGLALAFT